MKVAAIAPANLTMLDLDRPATLVSLRPCPIGQHIQPSRRVRALWRLSCVGADAGFLAGMQRQEVSSRVP